MRFILPSAALVFGFALSCGAAFADGDSGAMQQLENATSGNQTLSQTYGDNDGHGESCPSACPSDNANVPEPPAPTPVDTGRDGSDPG